MQASFQIACYFIYWEYQLLLLLLLFIHSFPFIFTYLYYNLFLSCNPIHRRIPEQSLNQQKPLFVTFDSKVKFRICFFLYIYICRYMSILFTNFVLATNLQVYFFIWSTVLIPSRTIKMNFSLNSTYMINHKVTGCSIYMTLAANQSIFSYVDVVENWYKSKVFDMGF